MPVDLLLSRLAKCYIVDFANADPGIAMRSKEWRGIYEVYHSDAKNRPHVPSPCYATSREFELSLDENSSAESLHYLFTEGPPAWFWYKTPPRMLSSIVEIFLSYPSPVVLRQIVCVSDGDGAASEPSLMWPEFNVDHFACHLCQRIQVGSSVVLGIERPRPFTDRPADTDGFGQLVQAAHYRLCQAFGVNVKEEELPTYITELSHVRNPRSGQVLTIEMWFVCCASGGPDKSLRKKGLSLAKVYIAECKHATASESAPGTSDVHPVARRRRVVVADVLLDSLKFLERYWLDMSLPLCREWRNTVDHNSSILALHPIRAEFQFVHPVEEERETGRRSTYLGDEWQATITNHARCLENPDVRTFEFRSSQAPEHSSAVIHRHLRNAHVQRVQCAFKQSDTNLSCDSYLNARQAAEIRNAWALGYVTDVFDWSIGMLCGLGKHTTVEELHILMTSENSPDPLTRLDESIRRRCTRSLTLSVFDEQMRIHCEHHNFFKLPELRKLTSLELEIFYNPRRELVPFWIDALYELPNCNSLDITYAEKSDPGLLANAETIPRALQKILEDFEAGRNIAVRQFVLKSPVSLAQCFEGRTPAYQGARCPGFSRVVVLGRSRLPVFTWEVYYFESPAGEWLTAFANPTYLNRAPDYVRHMARVKRGKILPITDIPK